MKASIEHIQVGCNSNAGGVAWGAAGSFGLVAYAAQHAVMVVDPQATQVRNIDLPAGPTHSYTSLHIRYMHTLYVA